MGGAAAHQQQPKPLQIQTPSPLNSRRGGGGRGVSPHSHFGEGALVEVRTDEEDFTGVYFAATVKLAPPSSARRGSRRKTNNKLYVEYHNLLASEDGSEPLREYVNPSFVRPFPPFQEPATGFELKDAVDAFYKDGWWTGVVSKVLEGGKKYTVTFEYPPDELEFGLADLRAHWDWVDGSWVFPKNQSIAGLMFDVGRKVEVSFDREDSQDAWFPAQIREDFGNGTASVEYCREDAEKKPQIMYVTVDSLHIRPSPPLLKERNFDLLAKVDAFFDYGWWSGVITKALENSKYTIFFKQMKEAREFHISDIRPHMEWKDGKWFTSSQLSQEVSVPSSDDAVLEQQTPDNPSASVPTVPANNLGDKKDSCDGKSPSSLISDVDHLTTDDQKMSQPSTSPRKRKRNLSGSQECLTQPLEKLKEGGLLGASEENTLERSVIESLSSSVVTFSATQTEGNLSSDGPSRGRRSRRKQRSVEAIQDVSKKVTSRSRKTSGTEIVLYETPEINAEGKKTNPLEKTAEDANIELGKEDAELPVIIGLPCSEIGSSGKSRGKRGISSNGKKMKINDKQLEDGGGGGKKKRGSLGGRISIDISQTPSSGDAQNEVVASDDKNRKGEGLFTEVEVMETEASLPNKKLSVIKDKTTNGRSQPKARKGSTMKRTLAKLLDEKVSEESIGRQDNHPLKRGRRKPVDVEKAASELPNNEFDDEPLSKWIEAKQSSFIHDISRLSTVNAIEKTKQNDDKQVNGVALEKQSEKQQPESGAQSSALVDEVSIVPSEQQSLPFSKNTILWKTIESMEVFKKIPQRPHFQPLEQFKESSREGLAIGYMVTFSSVVEKTSKLQFGDPTSVTEDILETLSELERHGFDVTFVRERVKELLAVREKREKLLGETKELNNQISEHSLEKSKIEEEIMKINDRIKELQAKLAVAESAKEKKNGEIASLQATLKEKEETIKNASRDFEAIAASTM